MKTAILIIAALGLHQAAPVKKLPPDPTKWEVGMVGRPSTTYVVAQLTGGGHHYLRLKRRGASGQAFEIDVGNLITLAQYKRLKPGSAFPFGQLGIEVTHAERKSGQNIERDRFGNVIGAHDSVGHVIRVKLVDLKEKR